MPVEQVVILGGGIAGWCTASALARKTVLSVTVIDLGGEDNSLGVPTPVVSTLPSAALFHDFLGHDEDALLAATAGTFSLGTAVSDLGPGAPTFIPFGEIGAPLGPIGFHHLVARLRSEGQAVNLANFSIAALCAQAGRFARPAVDDHSVLSTLDYGFHIQSAAYAAWLAADAIAHGTGSVAGRISAIRRDGAGLITDILLDNGKTIAGDLFVDASGPGAALLSQQDAFAFDSWAHWLALDRVAVLCADDRAAPPVYAHINAHDCGVRNYWPVQGGKAEQALLASRFAPDHIDTRPFTPGRCRQPWLGNCLALGAAAMAADPSSPIALHELHGSISRLLALLPHDRACRIEASEYNRQFDDECDGARDLMLLPYVVNSRTGDAFWDHSRAVAAPDRLRHRIALYKQTGRVAEYDGDPIDATGWTAWFDALGIRPARYDVMADGIPLQQLEVHLDRIRAIMLKALGTLPSHAEYLRQNCPAVQSRAA